MINAKHLCRMDIYWEAFAKVCELEGKAYGDPLEREFYATLTVYEELLAEKHGRRQRASRTRQKLASKGFIACLEDWALSPKRTEGFLALVAAGKKELTGEYLVTKYPDRFSPKAVTNARMIVELLEGDLKL